MKNNSLKYVITIVAFISTAFVVILIDIRSKFNKLDEIHEEYVLLEKSDRVNGTVTSLYNPKGFRSSPYYVLFVLNNEKKMGMFSDTKIEGLNLIDVLKEGAKLYKETNSDSVLIISGTDKYYFELTTPNWE